MTKFEHRLTKWMHYTGMTCEQAIIIPVWKQTYPNKLDHLSNSSPCINCVLWKSYKHIFTILKKIHFVLWSKTNQFNYFKSPNSLMALVNSLTKLHRSVIRFK